VTMIARLLKEHIWLLGFINFDGYIRLHLDLDVLIYLFLFIFIYTGSYCCVDMKLFTLVLSDMEILP
jgi:hypothetical protein